MNRSGLINTLKEKVDLSRKDAEKIVDTFFDALKEKLSKEKIFISFRGTYIRLSAHLYNTKDDFQKLTTCIASCLP